MIYTMMELNVKRQRLKAIIASMEFELQSKIKALDKIENEIKKQDEIRKKYIEEEEEGE